MDENTKRGRAKRYNEIQSGLFQAEQAARNLVAMSDLPAGERQAARKMVEQMAFYSRKIGIMKNAQPLDGRSAKINIYDEITLQ